MVRQGWNPSRRNRNIGTAKAGHGQDNSMVIPSRWSDDRVFWEKLHNPITIEKSVDGRAIVVLVEPVIRGFTHCCTPDDVFGIVEHLGAKELGDLRLFVLRQPKRKEPCSPRSGVGWPTSQSSAPTAVRRCTWRHSRSGGCGA